MNEKLKREAEKLRKGIAKALRAAGKKATVGTNTVQIDDTQLFVDFTEDYYRYHGTGRLRVRVDGVRDHVRHCSIRKARVFVHRTGPIDANKVAAVIIEHAAAERDAVGKMQALYREREETERLATAIRECYPDAADALYVERDGALVFSLRGATSAEASALMRALDKCRNKGKKKSHGPVPQDRKSDEG